MVKVGIGDYITLAKAGYKKSEIEKIIELNSREEAETQTEEFKIEDTEEISKDVDNSSPEHQEDFSSDSSELESKVTELQKMNEDLRNKIEELQKNARRENIKPEEDSNSDIIGNIVKSFM